jgi:predicted nucleotidyltransferase
VELTQTERRIVEDLALSLRVEFGATHVLLYGSAARGELQEGSDIDLFVVLPDVDWETEKRIVDRCFRVELECGRVISAACFTAKELADTPLRASPFVLNASREGVEL